MAKHLELTKETVGNSRMALTEAQIDTGLETHAMRYLFLPEFDLLCERTGLERHSARSWMRAEPPDDHSWYASVSLQSV